MLISKRRPPATRRRSSERDESSPRGGRSLPVGIRGVVVLLAPVLLAALVVTQTVGGDGRLVLDARLVGVGAGAVAIAARAPLPVVVIAAAAATALTRVLT